MNPDDASSLCLECGLCCNGVIFADGELRGGDTRKRLAALGLLFDRKSKSGNHKFLQPCSRFKGGCCQVYGDRPISCREFDCLLLKGVKAGQFSTAAASRVIRAALKRVKAVKQLLRALGDDDEQLALRKRFQRMQQRLEASPPDGQSAHRFAELSLAMHELDVLLSREFYPGP